MQLAGVFCIVSYTALDVPVSTSMYRLSIVGVSWVSQAGLSETTLIRLTVHRTERESGTQAATYTGNKVAESVYGLVGDKTHDRAHDPRSHIAPGYLHTAGRLEFSAQTSWQ